MSMTEIIKSIGDRTGNKDIARINLDGLKVDVKILDVKQVFGRVDVLITPINGSGEKWVQADRLVKKCLCNARGERV